MSVKKNSKRKRRGKNNRCPEAREQKQYEMNLEEMNGNGMNE